MGLLAIKEAAARRAPDTAPQGGDVAPVIVRTAEDMPDASRIGLIRTDRGGFEHYCSVCGAWGAFGYRASAGDGEWYCTQHRPAPP